jgi:hypothetical protein
MSYKREKVTVSLYYEDIVAIEKLRKRLNDEDLLLN